MPRIKQLLAAGQVVRVFAAGQLLSPKLIEIVGEHGEFDALWLDFEHAGISMQQIELATMAAKAYGMDHFVRLPATDYASVMRPLEAGAGGLMISRTSGPVLRLALFFLPLALFIRVSPVHGDGSGIKRRRLPPLGKSCTSHRRSLDRGRAATSDLASSPARSFQL